MPRSGRIKNGVLRYKKKMKKIFLITVIVLVSFLVYFGLDVADIENGLNPIENGRSDNNFKGELAIIIDDLGYSSSLDEKLLRIDESLTVAILPFLDNTQTAVNNFSGRDNFEIILHMPMEPIDEVHSEEFMLFTDQTKEETKSLFSDGLDQMEGRAIGVNNHKGSKFTSDRESMGVFLELVKERDLFFVDSYTINTSVGYDLAKELSIPTARRDVFLDYVDGKEEIREKLYEAVDLALENGSAIAIGHHKENTLQVLEEELSNLEKKGVKLVKVSDLLE